MGPYWAGHGGVLRGPYGGVCVNWHDYPERRLDSHFTTGVRIFAHDWGAEATRLPPLAARPTPQPPREPDCNSFRCKRT